MVGVLSPERRSYGFLILGSLSVSLICQYHVHRKKIWYTLFWKSFMAVVIYMFNGGLGPKGIKEPSELTGACLSSTISVISLGITSMFLQV